MSLMSTFAPVVVFFFVKIRNTAGTRYFHEYYLGKRTLGSSGRKKRIGVMSLLPKHEGHLRYSGRYCDVTGPFRENFPANSVVNLYVVGKHHLQLSSTLQ